MSLAGLLTAASFALTVAHRKEVEQAEEQFKEKQRATDGGEDVNASVPELETAQNTQEAASASERLVDIEEKRGPTPAAIDAFIGETVTLSAGQSAVVEIQATKGFDLRVSKIDVDRRDDHTYNITVGGDQLSGTSSAVFSTPRRVKHDGKVIIEISNNGGSETTQAISVEAWGEPV